MLEIIEKALEIVFAIGCAYYITKACRTNDKFLKIEYLLEACLSVLMILL